MFFTNEKCCAGKPDKNQTNSYHGTQKFILKKKEAKETNLSVNVLNQKETQFNGIGKGTQTGN